jgi:transcriptional antiterminator NusG
MAKGWYVIHAYSGHENKVEKQIKKIMGIEPFKEFVFDVKVPSEEVVEVREGKKRITAKNFLPGYILVEMDLPEKGWEKICSGIRRINGITGFVGTARNQKPQPISQEEVRAILQKAGEIKTERTIKPKLTFVEGEVVRIIDGPFNSFSGNIEEVNMEKGKLRVMVGIFGRSTPVELDFSQVEKV